MGLVSSGTITANGSVDIDISEVYRHHGEASSKTCLLVFTGTFDSGSIAIQIGTDAGNFAPLITRAGTLNATWSTTLAVAMNFSLLGKTLRLATTGVVTAASIAWALYI